MHLVGLYTYSSTVLSEIFLILRRLQRDVIINVYRSSCKVVRFKWNLNFLKRISKDTKIADLIAIRPLGAGCSGLRDRHTRGRTDRQTDSQTDIT